MSNCPTASGLTRSSSILLRAQEPSFGIKVRFSWWKFAMANWADAAVQWKHMEQSGCCAKWRWNWQSAAAVFLHVLVIRAAVLLLPLKIKINIYVGQEGTWDRNTAKPSVLCRSCSAVGSLTSPAREAGEAACLLLLRSSCKLSFFSSLSLTTLQVLRT